MASRCGGSARGEQPAGLLLLDSAAWADYVHDAPAVRLARLQFALSDGGTVLVRGLPLPALPGTAFTLEAGIACPCGFAWSPAVKAEAIAEAMQLKKDEIALFTWHRRPADGVWDELSCEVVPANAWVSVTRSAVRISLQGLPA